jgi:hypothetical protein
MNFGKSCFFAAVGRMLRTAASVSWDKERVQRGFGREWAFG